MLDNSKTANKQSNSPDHKRASLSFESVPARVQGPIQLAEARASKGMPARAKTPIKKRRACVPAQVDVPIQKVNSTAEANSPSKEVRINPLTTGLVFYVTPSHGYLRVNPVDYPVVRGFTSRYNYIIDGVYYLEEDIEAPTFLKVVFNPVDAGRMIADYATMQKDDNERIKGGLGFAVKRVSLPPVKFNTPVCDVCGCPLTRLVFNPSSGEYECVYCGASHD